MKKQYVKGLFPLLGLIVPFVAFGIVLRSVAHLTKSRGMSDQERLMFY